jgi:hypothetical protein
MTGSGPRRPTSRSIPAEDPFSDEVPSVGQQGPGHRVGEGPLRSRSGQVEPCLRTTTRTRAAARTAPDRRTLDLGDQDSGPARGQGRAGLRQADATDSPRGWHVRWRPALHAEDPVYARPVDAVQPRDRGPIAAVGDDVQPDTDGVDIGYAQHGNPAVQTADPKNGPANWRRLLNEIDSSTESREIARSERSDACLFDQRNLPHTADGGGLVPQLPHQ